MGLGYGCSGVPLNGRIFFHPSAQQETGLRRDRTTQRGRSLVVPRLLVRTRTGKAPPSGHFYWRVVLATASWCVEGYRTPDEAMVC